MSNPHFLTGLGAASSIFLSAAGSCFASVPSGLFAQHAHGIKAWFPIIISGVLAIYGCIISVILSHNIKDSEMTQAAGFQNLSAGLAVGLACLASGMGMARFVDQHMENVQPISTTNPSEMREGLISPMRANRNFPVTWGFLMVLVFMEAIGLYGLIIALFLATPHK